MRHSRLADPSSTIDVLRRHDLYTDRRLGQHLLVDDNAVGRILALADPSSDDVVLEVGPGIGTLTVALCDVAGGVVAVEADERMLAPLGEVADDCPHLRIVHADALRVSPDALVFDARPPDLLIANLPYGVAATVVLRTFETVSSIRSATVMVQSEVADRMNAQPGGKDYGAYTVKLRLHAEPAGGFDVARGCFLPPPRVDSTVVRMDRVTRALPGGFDGESRRAPELARGVLRDAARAADAAFAQRRKTVRNSVSSALGAEPPRVEEALSDAGIETGVRAESLGVEEYLRMGITLRNHALLP